MRKTAIIVTLAGAVALGGAFWLTRGGGLFMNSKERDEARAAAQIKAAAKLSKREQVAALAKISSLRATEELVKRYALWKGDPSALDARRDILKALYADPDLIKRLKGVLDAIAADDTELQENPLWDYAVDEMAKSFSEQKSLEKVRDLTFMEKRPQSQQLLANALARVADSPRADQLDKVERKDLAKDLIDLYFQESSKPFRGEIIEGVRHVVGNDPANLLAYTTKGVSASNMDRIKRRDEAKKAFLEHLANKPPEPEKPAEPTDGQNPP